jgi:hypothetical protein
MQMISGSDNFFKNSRPHKVPMSDLKQLLEVWQFESLCIQFLLFLE